MILLRYIILIFDFNANIFLILIGDYTTDSYEQGNGDDSGESTFEPKIPVKTR